LPPSSGLWIANFGDVTPYIMVDNIGVSGSLFSPSSVLNPTIFRALTSWVR